MKPSSCDGEGESLNMLMLSNQMLKVQELEMTAFNILLPKFWPPFYENK